MKEEPKTCHILLADDDTDDALVFDLALRSLSFPFILTHVRDGEELMRALGRQVPDILFLDIRMPCRDGIACIQEIRANSRYAQMPVVMYSSMRTPMNMAATYQKGAQYFLEKTGSLSELSSKLRFLFSRDLKEMRKQEPEAYLL
jgi:CheY-like chemotaxis protein